MTIIRMKVTNIAMYFLRKQQWKNNSIWSLLYFAVFCIKFNAISHRILAHVVETLRSKLRDPGSAEVVKLVGKYHYIYTTLLFVGRD